MIDIKKLPLYKEYKKNSPLILFVHGAACDHTFWCYQNRYFYNKGYSILSIDLPGHGSNTLKALQSINQMAAYIKSICDKLPQKEIYLIGHSMGSLICLNTALYKLKKVKKILLIGVSYPMMVSDQLLDKSKINQNEAIADMINWSLPTSTNLQGAILTGINLPNLAYQIMLNTPKGVLFKDLLACRKFKLKEEDFKLIEVKVTILAGESDIMTPLKGLNYLRANISNFDLIILKSIGHFSTLEAPIDVNYTIEKFLEDKA